MDPIVSTSMSPAGLSVDRDHIMEMACIITDRDLNIVAEVHLCVMYGEQSGQRDRGSAYWRRLSSL